jgi:helicase
VYRYSVEQGSYPIKTLEYKQMIGRAGRPQFDTEGEALLIAKKSDTVQWFMDRYILSDSEAIYSKLSSMPALRRSILGLIASKITKDVPELFNFMEKTFYGFQYEAVFLEEKIREVLDLFIVWEMIDPLDAKETLNASRYGFRVSQLYLDPQTAANLAEGLKVAVQKSKSKIHPVAVFDLLVGTPDMITLSFTKKFQDITEKRFDKFSKYFLKSVPLKDDIEYDFRLRDFHTALFIWDWINELPVERLVIRYKIGSGDIRRITDTATWLISSMGEIANIYSKSNSRFFSLSKNTELLSERVKYGIKSDAVSLTNIRGIGRKRARILLDHGIRKITQLVVLSRSELSSISGFGPELAKTILKEAKKSESSKEDFEEITSSLDDHFN